MFATIIYQTCKSCIFPAITLRVVGRECPRPRHIWLTTTSRSADSWKLFPTHPTGKIRLFLCWRMMRRTAPTILVISAYNRGGLIHRFVNTSDVFATMEEILGLEKLSKFDYYGRPLREMFTNNPNLTPY